MATLVDGLYKIGEVDNILNKDFCNEKGLCDYIEENIVDFCADCLGVEYSSHIREYSLSDERRRVKGNRRIDFLIITKSNERIGIECKYPSGMAELSHSVGQVLAYMTLFEALGKPLTRIVIVSTKLDGVVPLMISKFNLPIGFIGFDKNKALTFVGYGSTERK